MIKSFSQLVKEHHGHKPVQNSSYLLQEHLNSQYQAIQLNKQGSDDSLNKIKTSDLKSSDLFSKDYQKEYLKKPINKDASSVKIQQLFQETRNLNEKLMHAKAWNQKMTDTPSSTSKMSF